MSGHPYCRRLSEEDFLSIKEMTMAGIPPRQILTSLRQKNPKFQAIARTVYNARAKINKDGLAGRTPIQALLDELGQEEFAYDVEYDGNGHLTHLFFAHPKSVLLMRSYSNVFVMDCTYKTNRYKMPLLEIVGISSFNSSFQSCFAFLRSEEEADYVWALIRFERILGSSQHPSVIATDRKFALLGAIGHVFPKTTHLLCVWHIQKNILANCKKHFETKIDFDGFLSAWADLVRSSNELVFDEAWRNLEILYKDKPIVVNYLKGTWLPLKEKFVDAWTEDKLHFGTRVSSRAEGAHLMIKKYLQVSTGDLRQVKQKICNGIVNQYKEITAKFESEKLRIPHKFHIPLFKNLLGHVSVFALEEIYKQHEMAMSSILPPCKGQFSETMGLPCAHRIQDMKSAGFGLENIHTQWRFDVRSFSGICENLKDDGDNIDNLLKQFQLKYNKMSLIEKEDSRKQVCQLVEHSYPLIKEPLTCSHRGRPLSAKRKRESSSTTRDPSAFEIIEKGRKG
ncbi:hypothetical protein OROGR_001120 [Orobanche gracilis]